MTTPIHDDLATLLRAELAIQRREGAAQRARIARLERRRRLPRRALPLLLAALLVALVPLATLAANPFVDLNAGSPHNTNIAALYDAGITRGCDPGIAYCPNGTVTREEMASFLARAAGLGDNPPVANARTAQTAASAVNAQQAQQAANAAALGGQPPSYYQPVGQPVANAANAAALGGQPASAYQLAGQPVANATNAQVADQAANAALLGGQPPAYYQVAGQPVASATNAQNAANAAQLGGQPPSYYQPAGQPVANAANAANAQNADTLDGFHANALVRVVRGVRIGMYLPPDEPWMAYRPGATVTIVAPTAGYILVNGGVLATTQFGCPCSVKVRFAIPDRDASIHNVAYSAVNNQPSNASLTTVFAVGPGEHSVVAEVRMEPNWNASANVDTFITALFVPFGPTGAGNVTP